MSYALRLADRAKQGLTELPFDVQEEVIDFLDDLTNETRIRSRPRRASRDEIFDLDIARDGKTYCVFVVVQVEHRFQAIEVTQIGHVLRA